MNREVELGCESWTSFASGFSSSTARIQQLRSALVAGQWRGDTALTLPLFWRRSTVSPVFFGRYPRSSLHSFVPPPPPPPVTVPNKPPRFCGRKANWSRPSGCRRLRLGVWYIAHSSPSIGDWPVLPHISVTVDYIITSGRSSYIHRWLRPSFRN